MGDREDKKAEIIDFLNAKSRRSGVAPGAAVTGDCNVAGDHNTVIHSIQAACPLKKP